MKKILTGVCGCAALLVLLTGCDPQMAQIESGTQEAVWYDQLKENYSSFRPPQYPAPAIYNRNASAPAMERGRAVPPAEDPEKAVDRAADGENNVQVLNEENKQEAKAPAAKDEKKAQNAPAKTAPAGAEANAQKKDDKQPAPGAKAEAAEGKLYVVKSGDTLGSIAQKFYGRASMSDMIYRANGKVIKDRNRLQVGMRLVIPEL
jgi:nucleoid-associated protein YgaU